MAFTQIVSFTVKPEYIDAFRQVLLENKAGTDSEAGNIAMRMYTDNNNPNVIYSYERWQDEAAADYHRSQDYVQNLVKLADVALAAPVEILTLNDTTPLPVEPLKPASDDPRFNIFFIFKIQAGSRSELLQQFEKHITNTRTELGCLMFDLYTVDGDKQTLVAYEHWCKESDVWDIHFNQPYAVETGNLLEQKIIGDMQQYMHFVTQFA